MTNTSSLDTNAIVRLLVGDIPRQQKKVIELLSSDTQTFLVEDVAISEVVHVLETVYQYERDEVANYIQSFCRMRNILANKEVFDQTTAFYKKHPKLSFNDCYLAVMAEHRSAEPLFTFDKKLAKQLPSAKEL